MVELTIEPASNWPLGRGQTFRGPTWRSFSWAGSGIWPIRMHLGLCSLVKDEKGKVEGVLCATLANWGLPS